MIDPGRLARAIHLTAEIMADGRFIVSGGAAPHVVDPANDKCDCADASFGHRCKHLLSCDLGVLPSEILDTLRLIIPAQSRHRVSVG